MVENLKFNSVDGFTSKKTKKQTKQQQQQQQNNREKDKIPLFSTTSAPYWFLQTNKRKI